MNPIDEAKRSLNGLSVGDSFGERFFGKHELVQPMVEERRLPPAPWRYTDDTEMAMAIVTVLEQHGEIEQEALAREFGRRYRRNPHRGYGGGAHDILTKLNVGLPWREVSSEAFDGTGSMGNGGAMRVAPLGAYFANDDKQLLEQARRSAEVTHFHPDGQAGAIAIAAAAAFFVRTRNSAFDVPGFYDFVLRLTPAGPTREGIERARAWKLDATPSSAARELGNGSRVISSDTVPFALWCMARHPDHFEEALWCTVAGFGDRDTTCAIVGGVVALRPDPKTIPSAWTKAREPLSW